MRVGERDAVCCVTMYHDRIVWEMECELLVKMEKCPKKLLDNRLENALKKGGKSTPKKVP